MFQFSCPLRWGDLDAQGHVKLETTAIYAQVSIRKLKEIHTATHPARNERNGTGGKSKKKRKRKSKDGDGK